MLLSPRRPGYCASPSRRPDRRDLLSKFCRRKAPLAFCALNRFLLLGCRINFFCFSCDCALLSIEDITLIDIRERDTRKSRPWKLPFPTTQFKLFLIANRIRDPPLPRGSIVIGVGGNTLRCSVLERTERIYFQPGLLQGA